MPIVMNFRPEILFASHM